MKVDRLTTTKVRILLRADVPEVVRIEQDNAPHAWGEADLLRHLRNRYTHGVVVEVEGVVVGFAIYKVQPPSIRPPAMQILNLTVAVAQRRRWLGSLLFTWLEECRQRNHCAWLTTVVPETALDLQLFLKSKGFVAEGIVRGYFGGADGYAMCLPAGDDWIPF